MNLYFLVEGRQTERKMYPAWLSYAAPHLSLVKKPEEAIKNNFYLTSGFGYPSILDDHMPDAIETINQLGKLYTYFVVVLDSEGECPEARRQQVLEVEKSNPLLSHIQLVTIVQHPCIETWLLGNRKICSQKAMSKELQDYRKFYDVRMLDPELMEMPVGAIGSIANYHECYLKCVLRDRPGKPLSYNKDHPGITRDVTYWQELVARHENTAHMVNFGAVVRFFASLQTQLQES